MTTHKMVAALTGIGPPPMLHKMRKMMPEKEEE